MCSKPVLWQPDFDKTFYLQTDTSAYSVGAILSQEGDNHPNQKPKCHPIAFFSSTFSPIEQWYNIYEREFLGALKALIHWWPYLIWTKDPFIIKTDHENLTYWKSPKKLNRRTARWHKKLQDYNFKITHIAGKVNTPADALSRPNGADIPSNDWEMALLPPDLFIKIADTDSNNSLESEIIRMQNEHTDTLQEWETWLPIHKIEGPHMNMWKDNQGNQLVIPPINTLLWKIMRIWHDHYGAGHLGRDETMRRV